MKSEQKRKNCGNVDIEMERVPARIKVYVCVEGGAGHEKTRKEREKEGKEERENANERKEKE